MANAELTSALERLTCTKGESSDCTLQEMFDTSYKLYRLLEDTDLSPSSEKYQDTVAQNIRCLENCTKMVNELDLFSSNETIEEVSSLNIKYLLLPALLGSLSIKLQSRDLAKRLEQVQISEVYLKDYLKRCRNYGVCEKHTGDFEKFLKEPSEEKHLSSSSDVFAMADARAKKILKFNTLKQLKERESEMEKYLKSPNQDDDVIREYYLTLCEIWILTAIDELESINKEKEILQHFSQEKNSPQQNQRKPNRAPNSKSFAPMIITKNEIQKKVFGAGYPSLPVVSIEDFYKERFEKVVNEHKQASQGRSLQDMGSGSLDRAAKLEAEDLETEEKLEKDDPAALQKARAWDDWKDDNPRGSGNRMNKG